MGSSDKGELTAFVDRAGLFTSNSKQLIPYVDGRLILMLVHGILPPVFEQLLHPMSKSVLFRKAIAMGSMFTGGGGSYSIAFRASRRRQNYLGPLSHWHRATVPSTLEYRYSTLPYQPHIFTEIFITVNHSRIDLVVIYAILYQLENVDKALQTGSERVKLEGSFLWPHEIAFPLRTCFCPKSSQFMPLNKKSVLIFDSSDSKSPRLSCLQHRIKTPPVWPVHPLPLAEYCAICSVAKINYSKMMSTCA